MVSKRDVLNALKTMTFGEVTVGEVVVTPEDFEEFIDNSIESLDKRAAAAHKRQEAKKQAGDELRAQIKAVLDETPKTIAEIMSALNNPEVTNAMVVSRLGQLCKLQEVFKSDVKVDGGRTLKAYSTVEVVEAE